MWAGIGTVVALGLACAATVICGLAVTTAGTTTLVVTASATTVTAVATTGALALGTASAASQQNATTAWMNRSSRGWDDDGWDTPRGNQAQNSQFSDAVRRAEGQLGRRLTPDERRRVHDAITGQGYGFHRIVEEILQMFGCTG